MDAAATNSLPSTATTEGDSEVAVETPHNQGAITNLPPTKDATNENVAGPNANLPLFRLPRELRNMIYNLVIESEAAFHYDFALQAAQKPQISVFAIGGVSHTCKQLKTEYKATVEQHIKKLMSQKVYRGVRLEECGPSRAWPRDFPVLKIIQTQRVVGEVGAKYVHMIKVHVAIIPDWFRSPDKGNDAHRGRFSTLVFMFMFPGLAELPTRRHHKIQWDDWMNSGKDRACFEIPSDLYPAVQQVIKVAKGVDWKGSLRDYLLWQSYFVRCVKLVDDKR